LDSDANVVNRYHAPMGDGVTGNYMFMKPLRELDAPPSAGWPVMQREKRPKEMSTIEQEAYLSFEKCGRA
jgi:hypothetical protein